MRSRTLLPSLAALVLLVLPAGVAGATPPADGECTTDDLATVAYLVGADGVEVDDLRHNVVAGEQVEVQFTTDRACTFSLASFEAPQAAYDPDEVELQVLFSEDTILDAAPGEDHVLFVDVPDCFFQVDFAVGGVRVPPRYGEALVSADNGGAYPCETPTPPPSEEPSEEPTPEPSEEPSETPTPPPSEEPSEEPTPEPTEEPSEEPSGEPTDEPSEEASAAPVATASPTPTPTPVAAQGGGTGGALASTGLSTGPLVALGALALVGGSALLWVTQRRRGGTV